MAMRRRERIPLNLKCFTQEQCSGY